MKKVVEKKMPLLIIFLISSSVHNSTANSPNIFSDNKNFTEYNGSILKVLSKQNLYTGQVFALEPFFLNLKVLMIDLFNQSTNSLNS